ncbi:hypothetical protein CHCC20496_1307 [Bacillus licheniformis]|uniref:helix-turn-helix domain-containing protein n=1 Tax=Bacillus licheniformis TaxID=1402 RepID=UPI0004712A20|nr:helix-turn-helix transcriptional regulator [Bacillus licheniformis]TWJ83456.1 hypothetical protein CHCC20496_1307 [Bacillus licheniformis]
METRNRHPYNKIKAFFVENKIRHKDVAKILAVKPNTISKKLNGYGADFSLEDANNFGVPITYFFEPGVPKKERKIIS